MARRTILAGWLRRHTPQHAWQPAHRIRADRVDARDHDQTQHIDLAAVQQIAAGGAR